MTRQNTAAIDTMSGRLNDGFARLSTQMDTLIMDLTPRQQQIQQPKTPQTERHISQESEGTQDTQEELPLGQGNQPTQEPSLNLQQIPSPSLPSGSVLSQPAIQSTISQDLETLNQQQDLQQELINKVNEMQDRVNQLEQSDRQHKIQIRNQTNELDQLRTEPHQSTACSNDISDIRDEEDRERERMQEKN